LNLKQFGIKTFLKILFYKVEKQPVVLSFQSVVYHLEVFEKGFETI